MAQPAGPAFLVDLDQNADLDALLAGADLGRIRALFNHVRQLHASVLAQAGEPYLLQASAEAGYARFPHVAIPLISSQPARVAAGGSACSGWT